MDGAAAGNKNMDVFLPVNALSLLTFFGRSKESKKKLAKKVRKNRLDLKLT